MIDYIYSSVYVVIWKDIDNQLTKVNKIVIHSRYLLQYKFFYCNNNFQYQKIAASQFTEKHSIERIIYHLCWNTQNDNRYTITKLSILRVINFINRKYYRMWN